MLTTKREIIEWLEKYQIKNYTVNDDLTVDVDGGVYLNSKNLKEIPFQFGNVGSYFNCCYNQLTSLEHCPRNVGADFYCFNNPLHSIKELFDIDIKGDIFIPEHLKDSKEYQLLQKVRKLC